MAPILPFLAPHSLWITPLIVSQTTQKSTAQLNLTGTASLSSTTPSPTSKVLKSDPSISTQDSVQGHFNSSHQNLADKDTSTLDLPSPLTGWPIIFLPTCITLLVLSAAYYLFRTQKNLPEEFKSKFYRNYDQEPTEDIK